mmetsp:Transcript_15853/g.40922  ORF Transcript_15853/g.40922 Transcript_15853/m.40922 type:complete len:269 (+) Transcript_15853:64-870(+)
MHMAGQLSQLLRAWTFLPLALGAWGSKQLRRPPAALVNECSSVGRRRRVLRPARCAAEAPARRLLHDLHARRALVCSRSWDACLLRPHVFRALVEGPIWRVLVAALRQHVADVLQLGLILPARVEGVLVVQPRRHGPGGLLRQHLVRTLLVILRRAGGVGVEVAERVALRAPPMPTSAGDLERGVRLFHGAGVFVVAGGRHPCAPRRLVSRPGQHGILGRLCPDVVQHVADVRPDLAAGRVPRLVKGQARAHGERQVRPTTCLPRICN